MLSRGEFRSVNLYRAAHRGMWMIGVGDTRGVWDIGLADVPLDDEQGAMRAAEALLRDHWSLAVPLAWSTGRNGSWVGRTVS